MDLRYLEFVYFVRSMFGNWNSRNFFFFYLREIKSPFINSESSDLDAYFKVFIRLFISCPNKWVNEYS